LANFYRHLLLHLHLYARAGDHADLVIDLAELARNPEAVAAAEASLRHEAGISVDLHGAKETLAFSLVDAGPAERVRETVSALAIPERSAKTAQGTALARKATEEFLREYEAYRFRAAPLVRVATRLQEQLASRQTSLAASRQEVEQAQREAHHAGQQAVEACREADQARCDAQQARREAEEARSAVANALEQGQQEKAIAQAAAAARAVAETALAAIRDDAAATQAALQAIHDSEVWRATWPLRALLSKLRRSFKRN
jgi:hypothetical protein